MLIPKKRLANPQGIFTAVTAVTAVNVAIPPTYITNKRFCQPAENVTIIGAVIWEKLQCAVSCDRAGG
jgi:hypothetical protein